jgi:phage terminase small subunit
LCCLNYDRFLEARELVNKHGLVIKSKSGQVHGNPAVGMEERAYKNFCKGWQVLGLAMKPPVSGDEKGLVRWDDSEN